MAHLRQWVHFVGAALLLASVGQARSGEVAWEQSFTFIAPPPELDLGWEPRGAPVYQTTGDTLELTTTTDGGGSWVWTTEDGGWDATLPTTVEFRMRAASIDSDSEAAAHLVIKNNDLTFAVKLTNPEFKTYRVVVESGQARVYDMEERGEPTVIEGVPLNRQHPDSVLLPNSIAFGDMSTSIGGVSEWKFLRWTNQGAYEP